ncbi:hypothetical protein LB519_14805 [Mesorhizobium sp. AD1-1]|uniref:hypothetical protein n=1 Tax=Mesorhizobium sp. AD1-1 TaxID=2876621 RepID=UPI001CC9B268|nr:hypothetical protein [Mesorhizobium sp. AD1-1]MBZ9719116.1 hypothetical protein [Mesorhizobium sp. AD1-1]
MNAHAPSPDTLRLRAIQQTLAQIAPADWTRAHDGDADLVESHGEMGELFQIVRFGPAATLDEIEFVCNAPETVRFLLRLLGQAFDKIRELNGEPPRRNAPVGPPAASGNFAAECAMRCQDAAFKVFLEERHGLERPLTDERVEQRVRSLLGVTSRKELNDGGAAAQAWKTLRADFAAWLKAER